MKNRKTYTVSKIKDNMVNTFQIYGLALDFTTENFIIEVDCYNQQFFNSPDELVNAYGLFFQDLVAFNNLKGKKLRVIEFLKDSVENNDMLMDSLTELDFKVKGSHILFKYNGEKQDFINMGEFYIDNYKVAVCHSYMFFEDILSEKKYMYYGD